MTSAEHSTAINLTPDTGPQRKIHRNSITMPKAPTLHDFPASIRPSILTSSPPNPRSLLIMFHGLGDTNVPLLNLGRQLNLPSTAVLSIKAPNPIPALFLDGGLDVGNRGEIGDKTGWHWGDDILIDQSTGELDLDTGFNAASKVSREVLRVTLGYPKADGGDKAAVRVLGFDARDVFLWGFGQGGMVALSLAEALPELGGVISIGSKIASSKSAMEKAAEGLPEEVVGKREVREKVKTPVLLCGGNRKTAVTQNILKDVKERFAAVHYVKWEREGDFMARNREEMLPIMKFLADRLRMGSPMGMSEVSSVSRD